jgi:hypothetical protein
MFVNWRTVVLIGKLLRLNGLSTLVALDEQSCLTINLVFNQNGLTADCRTTERAGTELRG